MSSDLYRIMDTIRKVNKENGWDLFNEEIDWEDTDKLPAKLALVHSEVSEGLEAFRGEKVFQPVRVRHSDKDVEGAMLGYMRDMTEQEKQDNFREEMADVVIRVLDLMAGFPNSDFVMDIWDKINKNAARGYKHGGKKV